MQKFWFVLWVSLGLSGPAVGEGLYDYACCPKDDCRAALGEGVVLTWEGYRIEALGVVVAQDDPRIRPSRDGRYHLCTRSRALPGMSQTQVEALQGARVLKCLYVPQMSAVSGEGRSFAGHSEKGFQMT